MKSAFYAFIPGAKVERLSAFDLRVTDEDTFDASNLNHGSFFQSLIATSTHQQLCNFVQATNDDFNWTRLKGSTSSFDTGPSSDHTSGSGWFKTNFLFNYYSLGDSVNKSFRCFSSTNFLPVLSVVYVLTCFALSCRANHSTQFI